METDTGGAHVPSQLYCIYCISTFCALPHTLISLSDELKIEELVSFSIMLHVIICCTNFFNVIIFITFFFVDSHFTFFKRKSKRKE